MARARCLRERRRAGEERMDPLWAPMYDAHWGATTAPLHRHMVERFLDLCPAPARILDAACGTGKYWPLLLGRARTVVGIDQSWGMLQRARPKFPAAPIRKLGLQELAEVDAFEGIACIDAMELVCAEDWPRVLANFHRALIPGGVLYLTVELPQPDLADVFRAAVDAGLPVTAGEYVKDGGYHYYPRLEQVKVWLAAAGFELLEEAEADEYHHLLARKPRR